MRKPSSSTIACVSLTAVLTVALLFGFMVGTARNKETHGQVALNGIPNQGASIAGFVPLYSSTGTLLSGYSCVLVTGASTTSGTFSLSYTTPTAWTTPSAVWVDSLTIVSPGSGITQGYDPYITTLTSTNLAGVVRSGTTLAILGATLVSSTTAANMTAKLCSY